MRSRWRPDSLSIEVAQIEMTAVAGVAIYLVMHTFAPLVHSFTGCQTAASEYSELECHGAHVMMSIDVIFCLLAAIL